MSNNHKIYIELLDCGVTYDCKDAEDVQNAIIEEYDRSDITIQLLLTNVAIHGLSAEDVTYIYCNLLNKINKDEFVQFYGSRISTDTTMYLEGEAELNNICLWYE